MPPLHTLPTLRTPADGNIKTPYPRPAHDLFLILRLDPLYGQRTCACRTLRRKRHQNLLIHSLRDGPTVMCSIADARLATWGFRMTLALASRKRSRLTPGRALRAARPPVLFASARSLPAAAHFPSLHAACPAAPDPVAHGLGVAPVPVL